MTDTHFIPFIGGKAHLQTAPAIKVEIIKQDGCSYKLTAVEEFGNRAFYVATDIANQPSLAVYSYLQAYGRWSEDTNAAYQRWYKAITSFRTNPAAWIYVDAVRFFKELPDEPMRRQDFKRAVADFMFVDKSEEFQFVLRLLQDFFPQTFFVPRLDRENDQRRVVEAIKPLSKNIFDDLFGLLKPKNIPEAEKLTLCLAYYCNSTPYLLSLAKGNLRINLQGLPTGLPTLAERRLAADTLISRKFKIPKEVMNEIRLRERNEAQHVNKTKRRA